MMSVVTKHDQDNYPEMLGHICIINAPYVFRMVWNVVKGFIDPRTQGKIEVRMRRNEGMIFNGLTIVCRS